MSEYSIFLTGRVKDEITNMDNSERKRVNKILDKLKQNISGKPLSGLDFFREKKIQGKRIYFLVYRDLTALLIVGIINKKSQAATINGILLELDEYGDYVKNLIDSA